MEKGRALALLIGFMLSVGMAVPVAAEEPVPPRSYLDGATRKLGRGIANVITAPLEMIRTPTLVGQRDGGFASLTVGIVQGVKAAVLRELAGVIEVVTCVIPIPKNFQPVVRPEFVYAHGDWSP